MVNQDGLYLFLKFEDDKINQNYQNLIKRVLNQNYLSFLSILSISFPSFNPEHLFLQRVVNISYFDLFAI